MASYNLGIKFIKDDLPLPVLPMNAMVSPLFALNDIFLSKYSFEEIRDYKLFSKFGSLSEIFKNTTNNNS